MQTLYMILAHKGGKKTICVKENIVPVTSTLLENGDAGWALEWWPVPASSHTPSADTLERSKPTDSPGAWERNPAGSQSVRPASIDFSVKKRTANNQTHLSNKNRMGHQAGISTLNQGKPAGLLTGPEDLGWGMGKADRRPLRKQECGSCQWRISENVKGSWPGTWKSCGYGGPRSLRCKREGSGLVQETTTTKQAGATVGVVRSNKKRHMTPCENHYAFELFFEVGNATKFSGKTVSRDLFCLEVGKKWYPQSNRKDPLPTANWLNHRGKLPLSNPCIPKNDKTKITGAKS